MSDNVGKRGATIVGVVVFAVVALAVWLSLARDDLRGTAVEDAVAGRESTAATADPTDSDPGLTAESTRPQGRLAPDSQEGVSGAGSSALTRDTPALNPGVAPTNQATVSPNTGRNLPASPGANPQTAPVNDLESGANADREESARIPR